MTITVRIEPGNPDAVRDGFGRISAEVVYQRQVADAHAGPELPTTIVETVRAPLDPALRGSVQLLDPVPGSGATLRLLSDRGETSLEKPLKVGNAAEIRVHLTKDDLKLLHAPPPPTSAPVTLIRAAQFVPTTDVTLAFAASSLQVAPLRLGSDGWTSLGLDTVFRSSTPMTMSIEIAAENPLAEHAHWIPIALGADGRFTAGFEEGSGDAWLWWLSGPHSAAGVVIDDLGTTRVSRRAISLPPFASLPAAGSASDSSHPARPIPADVTEAEVASNPEIYTEDAGAYCRPFRNPARILGERSFFVILRAEQPSIGAGTSVRPQPLPVLTFHPPTGLVAARLERAPLRNEMFAAVSGAALRDRLAVSAPVFAADERVDSLLTDASFTQADVPPSYIEAMQHVDRGRVQMDAAHPVQWEGDATRYQATSVARGHILELRIRWRSNGYSLGTVARTLTLAPRQTRRIQKIEWRRSERARREELTQLDDRVADAVTRERTYEDEVRAGLSEWAQGESESSTTSGAGGFGFAAAGFVIGGGGGGSTSSSSSNTAGGREATASEEQRLQDEIRRWADALRRLDSVVVNEVTQDESVTGTTEVVRNPNYGHALTVLYHQILRHLKVETAFAGVRECLFVPFALRPFTLQRVVRWREPLTQFLRERRLLGAFDRVDDVLSGFATSDVPPGRRSDQRVWHIHGSLFLRLGIERPIDAADGSFDEQAWKVLLGLVGTPPREVHARLVKLEEKRDRVFQREQAPRIAAAWANTLELWVGNDRLPADFTLASGYRFNDSARIDFSVPLDATSPFITRERLGEWRVVATRALTPGSVANVERVGFTYQTDHFTRSVTVRIGANDLVSVETGAPDPGATVASVPDDWERRDERLEIVRSVQELIGHLNEHVEYYHKAIWWNMDRDRIWMLLDGMYVPGTSAVSVASVVERDPIAIIGNSLVFRVAAGSFIGIDNLDTPAKLHAFYAGRQPVSDPLLISLPTDGLYAQTIMDECEALEEHFGNTDWVLNQVEPDLGTVDPSLLATRRAEPPAVTPTTLPQTIINLQNAPDAPAPTGVAGALGAISSPAFRDLAGLEGTQANARAGFDTAAGLASSLGAQATALKLAEIAQKEQAAKDADKKLATVQRAVDKKLVPAEEGQRQANRVLEALHTPASASPPHNAPELADAISAASGMPGSTVTSTTPDGFVKVSLASALPMVPKVVAAAAQLPYGIADTVPDVVFIPSDWSVDPSGFLQHAHTFHAEWKLPIVEINSIEDIVEAIAAGKRGGVTVKIGKRFRVVSHAADVLLIPLFNGWPAALAVDNVHLDAAAASDVAIVNELAATTVSVPSIMTTITTGLAGTTVGPHTISAGVAPAGALDTFIQRRAERRAIETAANLVAAEQALMIRALDLLLADASATLRREGATVAELNGLEAALDAMQPANFTLPVTMPQADEQAALQSALDAITRGFRANLTNARKKLRNMALDVRGCSIGQFRASLEALSKFFSAPGTTMPVTAPDFFQGFPAADLEDVVVNDKSDLETKMTADVILTHEMDAHATSKFAGKWAAATTPADRAQVFFTEVFAKGEALPVFHVEFDPSGNPTREVLRLFMAPGDAPILRFLLSLWGSDVRKQAKVLQKQWKNARSSSASLPRLPSVSRHLHPVTNSNPIPQVMFVCPTDGYRSHIQSFP